MLEAPIVSDELLSWLERVFPEELPMTDDPVDYYRAQGRKLMIRRLYIENRKQQLNIGR